MSKKQSSKPALPSFEDLTGKSGKQAIPARIQTEAASHSAPPGGMRVFGENPAKKWFGDLPETNPDLCREILAQLQNLRGEEWRNALWAAYIRHYYSADRQDDERFDFSKLFE